MQKLNAEMVIRLVLLFFIGAALFFTVNIILFKRQMNISDENPATHSQAKVMIENSWQAEKEGEPDV